MMKTLNLLLNIVVAGLLLLGGLLLITMLGFQSHSVTIGYIFLGGLAALMTGLTALVIAFKNTLNTYAINTVFVIGLALSGLSLIAFLMLHLMAYEAIKVTESEVNRACLAYALIGIPFILISSILERKRLSGNASRQSHRLRRRIKSVAS